MSQAIAFPSPNLVLQSVKFQNHASRSRLSATHLHKLNRNPPRTLKISCSKDGEGQADEILAAKLDIQMKKLNIGNIEREEALRRSRALLFKEMCNFTGLKSEDLKIKWKGMKEEERKDFVGGFVSGWSAHFHPLSARSVKEMVEDYLGKGDDGSSSDSVSGNQFPGFRKLLGFPLDGEGWSHCKIFTKSIHRYEIL